jgi:transcriptional regulator with XRE-family HTH domain
MSSRTPLGMFLAKFRIDKDEKLKTMAGKLYMTSSYLSAIELGKRPIPDYFCKQIADIYGMTAEQKTRMMHAAHASPNHGGSIRLIELFNLMIDMAQAIIVNPFKNSDEKAYNKGYMAALSELQNKLKNGENNV